MTADSTLQFDYLRRIWLLRHFWFSLVANDIRSRYRRSILGVGWSLLRPLGMTAIFCVVFGTLFNQNIATYAPYVLIGMTTWQFLMESLTSGCH
jgi:lipopolysaccharide transport system permease protein